MNKKGKIAIVTALVVIGILFISLAIAKPVPRAAKACSDGIDNDGDSLTDWPNDPGCSSKNDRSELDPNVECDDGIDNDGDSATDYNDGGCSGPTDTDESDCGDGVCEGGETSGTCPQDCGYADSCADTDGGIVITTFGTTSGYLNNVPYSNNDFCTNTSSVNEYYCNGNYEASTQLNCGTDSYGANYCSGGDVYHDYTDYFCTSGACANTVTPVLVETCTWGCTSGQCDPAPDSCSDTDGGFVILTAGTTSGNYNGLPYSNSDYCVDSTTLKEYYCSGNYEYSASTGCLTNTTSSCVSGACI